MRVTITKHTGGYTAEVTPFDIALEWLIEKPMDLLSLWTALQEVGFSMIDVSDAFAAADPEIRKEQQEAGFLVLSDSVGPERAAQIGMEVDEELRLRAEATKIRMEENKKRQAEALRIRMEEYWRLRAKDALDRRDVDEF